MHRPHKKEAPLDRHVAPLLAMTEVPRHCERSAAIQFHPLIASP